MHQILQNLGSGETLLADVPAPGPKGGSLLVRTSRSLISLGTERMLVNFGRAGWLEKARQQPEKVRQVLEKIRVDGLFPTLDAVRSKLDTPLPLGYCQVGVVEDAGGASPDCFKPGQRVVTNGPHAEVVSVGHNLCAAVPDAVSDEAASFAVVGAIGLQGIRLLAPALGERIVVTGLGLIGLLVVQMLRANGCDVLGLDFDASKCALAESYGARTLNLANGADPVAEAMAWTKGRGVDGVLITASAKSNDPVRQAARMCRQRGRIVLVGVTGLELDRGEFYQKELSFQVSCSYGPGRYDPSYEDRGLDYPFGLVRWTEQRNIEAVLGLLAAGRIDVSRLVTHRFPLSEALRAYDTVSAGAALGIVLEYQAGAEVLARTVRYAVTDAIPVGAKVGAKGAASSRPPRVAVLGTGNYATRTLLPALRGLSHELRTVVSAQGVSGAHAAKKFGAPQATTDTEALWRDPEIDAVLITTRHHAHARQALAALRAGKHVWVEKPLCLTLADLAEIETAAKESKRVLMVGFNRRFAPMTLRMRELLRQTPGPKVFVCTVNAGAIPREHWTQDPMIGGGRIIGEACHFIDLLRHLAGAAIVSARADYLGGGGAETRDSASLSLRFADGSVGTVHYLANGPKAVAKERLEVFAAGKHLRLDNWRSLEGTGFAGFGGMRSRFSQDKGHRGALEAFLAGVAQGDAAPIALDEITEVSRVSIELAGL